MFEDLFQLNEVDNQGIQDQMDDNIEGTLKVATEKQYKEIINKYYKKYVFDIDLQTDLFAAIQFPSLPRNYRFLISPFDWPKKAEENPNGSLFGDPNKIDANSADDIAMQCFGGEFDSSKMKSTTNTQAYAKEFSSLNTVFNTIVMNEAMNAWWDKNPNEDREGVELAVRSINDHNSNMQTLSTDVSKAIRNYVSRSVEAVTPLIQMTGGNVRELMKKINTANSAAWDNVKEWIDAQSEVQRQKRESIKDQEMATYKNAHSSLKKANNFMKCVMVSDIPADKRSHVIAKISSAVNDVATKSDLDDLVTRFSINYTRYANFEDDLQKNDEKPFKIRLNTHIFDSKEETPDSPALNETKYTYTYLRKLNEAVDDREAHAFDEVDPRINYDKLYEDLYHFFVQAMNDSVGEREQWHCFKTVREEMKVLKDRADEEIKKKIELVCKTGDQKSLIKWPFKAEGLLSMWTRYSSELQLRMNNRIDQLMGSNGGVETGSANLVEDFLKTTYPQILAVLLTYRCMFQQLAAMYKNNMIPKYTLDDFSDVLEVGGEEYYERVDGPLNVWFDDTDESEPIIIGD